MVQREGNSMPTKERKVYIPVRVNKKVYKKLEDMKWNQRRSLNQIINEAIINYYKIEDKN